MITKMKPLSLNGNQIKMIALIAMTIDHLICVIFPNYPSDWWIVGLHMIGRIAAPVFWFFVAEGYHYTRDLRKYAAKLFVFAVISHFAYNFAFGIPFIPFKTSVFNQTSVIWALFWGLVALAIQQHESFKDWQKMLMIIGCTIVAFIADWSSIAVLGVMEIGAHRGDFKKQMTRMMIWVGVYALIYVIFINPLYGVVQLFVALAIPLLKLYNGERGSWKGMSWFFYAYYPLHLVLCGFIRLALHGNIPVMIGG